MSLFPHNICISLSISICLFVAAFSYFSLSSNTIYVFVFAFDHFYLYSLLPYLSLYFCICNRGELVRTADLSVAGQGDASGQLRLHKMRKSISIRHRSQTSTSAFLTFSSVVSRSTSIMSTVLSISRLVMSLVSAQEWLHEIRILLMVKGMNCFWIMKKNTLYFPAIHVFFWTNRSEAYVLNPTNANQGTINCGASSQADFIPLKIPQFS